MKKSAHPPVVGKSIQKGASERRIFVGLERKVEILTAVVKEFHWRARRYADGRSTYATSSFNQAVRDVLQLGIKLHGNDRIIWARDGQGRDYDHLSPREAEPGTVEALGICGTGVK